MRTTGDTCGFVRRLAVFVNVNALFITGVELRQVHLLSAGFYRLPLPFPTPVYTNEPPDGGSS